MFKILSLLYLADVYSSMKGLIIGLTIITGLVMFIWTLGVFVETTESQQKRLIVLYTKWMIRLGSMMFILLVVNIVMPSQKFVERACYVGVGYELTNIAISHVPDPLKVQASDAVSGAVSESLKLPANMIGLLNGWASTKLKSLESEVLGDTTATAVGGEK